jgi:hypothetical protein
MGEDKIHNEKGAGRKKVYNQGAFLTLEKVKRAHMKLLNSPLKKNERDPITQELKEIKSYLEVRAYTPPDVLNDVSQRDKSAMVERSSNRDIVEQHAEEVNDLIVKGHSLDTIKRALYDLSKQVVATRTIDAYRTRYKATEEYQEAYGRHVGSLDSMRLYTKVGRLEELTIMYEEAYTQHRLLKTRDSQNQVLKILDQARREADSPAVYNFQMNQNNMQINGTAVFNLLQRETEKDLIKGLLINEIVLGRIAAKTGVSALILMKRLHTSYYANQSGINGLSNTDEPIAYPSEIMYDIESMTEKSKKLAIEEAKIVDPVDDVDEEISPLKLKLLERIRSKQKKDEDK